MCIKSVCSLKSLSGRPVLLTWASPEPVLSPPGSSCMCLYCFLLGCFLFKRFVLLLCILYFGSCCFMDFSLCWLKLTLCLLSCLLCVSAFGSSLFKLKLNNLKHYWSLLLGLNAATVKFIKVYSKYTLCVQLENL